MSELLVPYQDGQDEFVEKKSRFIGNLFFCETEADALRHLEEIRKVHPDCSHVAYAYSIRTTNSIRFSDDGEPGGTAGMPIYEVLRREGLDNFLCTVTRYFGGTLLGAGGLTRAYGKGAKIALDAAGIALLKPVSICFLRCPYSLYELIKLEIATQNGEIIQTGFAEDVSLSLRVPQEQFDALSSRLVELSSGSLALREDAVTEDGRVLKKAPNS